MQNTTATQQTDAREMVNDLVSKNSFGCNTEQQNRDASVGATVGTNDSAS